MRKAGMSMGTRQHTRASRCVSLCALVLCAFVVLCCATGCRNSDALKEVIYEQTAQIIDYENPTKFYINDSTAKEKSDKVPSSEVNKNAQRTEAEQNIVVYSSTPNSPQYVAKQSVWDPKPDFTGIEASNTVHFYESDDPNATEQDIPTQKKEEQDEASEPQATTTSTVTAAGKKGASGNTGSKGSGSSKKKGKKKSAKAPKNEKADTKGPGGGDGGETKVGEVDLTDPYAEPPKVSQIAAFGELAVMVQMVGGEKALMAADKELLDTKFTTVFKGEGAKDIAQGWSDDGSAKKINVDKIIGAKADKKEKAVILAYSSDYVKDLSNKDKKKLKAANIEFAYMARPTTSKSITNDVTKIGDMLSESKVIGQAGKTQDNADNYVALHNEVVKKCISSNGIGKLAGKKRYEQYKNKKDEFDANADYTLLLDAYDTSVRFDNRNEPEPKMNGIALSRIGYTETPVSYYIQAGGLTNNAAERGGTAKEGLCPVWQFATPTLKKNSFSYDSDGAFNECVIVSGTSWERVLLTTELNKSDSSGAVPGSSFGTDVFPKLIAANQMIKEKVLENSQQPMGAYHPYSFTSKDAFSGFGLKTDKGALMACIGVDGNKAGGVLAEGFEDAADPDNNAIPEDRIEVNPHGLFSSWTEGGSVESFLEAAWVNDVVNVDHSSEVGWKSYVEHFYTECYRYEDFSGSDLTTIEEGLSK